MALSPNDSGGSQSQPINFTNRAADRIVKAVRKVEAGNRDQVPYFSKGELLSGNGKQFRIATFTGSWSKESSKTVTFKNQTATPNTVSATNLLYGITSLGTAGTATVTTVVIGKEGTAWYFVNDEHVSCSFAKSAKWLDGEGYDLGSDSLQIQGGEGPQVLVNDKGCVKWMKLARLRVVHGQTPIQLTGAGLQYNSKDVWVLNTLDSGGQGTIPVTSCSSTASA